jgi:hypothetical protein
VEPFLARSTGKEVLRQIWPVIRYGVICANHRDAAGISFPPQHFRRSVTCGAASHDDDVLWRLRGPGRPLLLGLLFAHEELAAACFNLPRADRVKRRSAKRLTGAKTKTGVMPRAPDGIAHHKAFGQRAAIMGTGRAYGEVGIGAPSHQDGLAIGVALQHAAVGKLCERDPLLKVGSAQFLFFCHLSNSLAGP